jgi:nitrilase
LGQIIAGPEITGEAILCAELDMGEITRGKFDFDVVGHYARPDVFRLNVIEQSQSPVVTSRPTPEGGDD